MYGYNGKMLFVNLTDGSFKVETFDEDFARCYIGGYGFGAKVLLERMPKNTAAFDEASMIGFISGVANATGPMFGGRYTVVSKSPVYDGWNDANSGGYFGPALKRSGFDAVFVSGISEKPVYLYLNDGTYELRDAAHLWGHDGKETWEILKGELGESVRIATIGQAGENMMHMAAIMNDGHRAAGRGGSGAVMGSKKLKAIAAMGSTVIEVSDRERLNATNKVVGATIKDPPAPVEGMIKGFSTWGTGILTQSSILSGDAPVRNWGGSVVDFPEEHHEKFALDTFQKDWYEKGYGCAQCPLRCGAEYNVKSGKWPIGASERPEYETMAAFGSNCLNSDLDAIQICNDLCNRAGIDTISCGSTIAWVMESYENGALTKEDLDGIEANWGNADAMVALMQKIVRAEGCGKILGNGQKYAAEYFGRGQEFESNVAGIEPGMHDYRLARQAGYARVQMYDPTPGRHVRGGDKHTPLDAENRGTADLTATALAEVNACAGFCMFGEFALPPTFLEDYLSAVLGGEFTTEEIINAGKRIFLLRHAFNLREGFTRDQLKISKRLLSTIKDGPNANVVPMPHEMADKFYEAMGLDVATGAPDRALLERIGGLEVAIEALGL